jgi:general secretion pathway protein K
MMAPEPDNGGTPARQRGIALIAVLFVLTLMALFAAGLARDTRNELLLARNFVSAAQAEAVADAAVHRAIAELAYAGAQAPSSAENTSPGSGGTVETGVTTIIEDEGGKIDLNRGHPNHLRELLHQLGIEEYDQLADAIADFRDADDSRRNKGAEWPDYRAQGLPYVAHNRPFRAVSELRLVLGMSEEYFRLLEPYVTVYSRRRGVDPRYAPEMVLRAIPGLDEASLDTILEQRGTGTTPTLRGAYVGRSNRRAFTIRAEAVMPDGSRFVRHAVIELRGRRGGHRVHQWLRGASRTG